MALVGCLPTNEATEILDGFGGFFGRYVAVPQGGLDGLVDRFSAVSTAAPVLSG